MTCKEAIRIIKEIHSATNTILMEELNSLGRERALLDDCKALTMAIQALDKQIPKKPTKEHGYFRCQDCGHPFTNDEFDRKATHCECGQAILWEDEP